MPAIRAQFPAKEHDVTKPHSRLQVDTLVALIGVEATANLCHFGGGHRVPSYDQFRSWERRVRLLNDYLKHGYTHRDLAAKYGLSLPVVKRMVTAFRRQQLQAERMAASAGTR
jgi:hypothetical protein